MQLIIAIIFVLISTFEVFAAPSISVVSGTIKHNDSITISGSSFGTKTTAAPILWENFEDGIDGNNLEDDGEWDCEGKTGVTYEHDGQRSSTSTMKVLDTLTYGGQNGPFKKSVFSTGDDKLFVDFWFRIDFVNLDASDDWQLKLERVIYGVNHGDCPAFAKQTWWTPSGDVGTNHQYIELCQMNPNASQWQTKYFTDQQWIHVQYWIDQSSSVDQQDGALHYRCFIPSEDSSEDIDVTSLATRTTGYDNKLLYLKFGYYIANNLNNGHKVETSWDDIYADNTWARVEIGDNAIYSNCTHRETQIPSAWSSTSITVTVNRGSFGGSDTAYLFVVDSDGNVSSGYQIQFEEMQVSLSGGSHSISIGGGDKTITFGN